MTRLQAALRCSATLVALALITAPVAFAPSLFGSGFALAQTTRDYNSAAPRTDTVNPDTTYGPGGNSIAYGQDGRLTYRQIRDADGNPREIYSINRGQETESWQFYLAPDLSRPVSTVGAIISKPIIAGADLWELTVYGPDGKVIGGHSDLSRNDLEVELSYWHGTLRSDAGGSARGTAVRFTDGPGVGQTAGPPQFQPQPGGLTIQCFGDAACERALAASRGQFDYGIRTLDDGKAKSDDRKDRPLYERPDLPRPELPRNALPYEVR